MVDYHKLIQLDIELCRQKGYKFTSDWFHGGIKYDIMANIDINPADEIHILEIGAYEGKSSVWFMDTFLEHPDSSITIVDPFLYGDTTTNVTMDTFINFNDNIVNSRYFEKAIFFQEKSCDILPSLIAQKKQFDIIFIDGSHLKKDVTRDIVLCDFLSCRYIILDDYNNRNNTDVKDVVDFFLNIANGEYEVVHDRYQIILRKNLNSK
jgi:hypothetical protein